MSASTGDAPIIQTIRVRVAAVGTAGNDLETVLGSVSVTGHVNAWRYIPDATQAGAATNYRDLKLKNETASKTCGELDMSANDATHNLTAFTVKAMPLSGTATDYDVTAGDVLTFDSVHVGTGITDPGGSVEVDIVKD
ncbi:MAG: hypothetical protein KGJ86_00270 [Chloroflexota bacterium]|nr:hypothetical protein [Chloroflexota bacterium]